MSELRTDVYVKVDEDGPCIWVYVQADENTLESFDIDAEEFWRENYGTQRNTRVAAELHARRLAEQLNCDWGTNYGPDSGDGINHVLRERWMP